MALAFVWMCMDVRHCNLLCVALYCGSDVKSRDVRLDRTVVFGLEHLGGGGKNCVLEWEWARERVMGRMVGVEGREGVVEGWRVISVQNWSLN
ncbi:hypothetical protein B0J14DRAFT_104188 [Halenospora varia]|nr:hypothetical protein B0J14DRAFT_104188 [Halenospora varia]